MPRNTKNIEAIIKAGREMGLTTPQLAYILGTAEHETNNTFNSVAEGYYLKNPSTFQRSLSYYPYIGRGMVQLTHKANYERAQREVIDKLGYKDVNIVKNPDWLTSKDPRVDNVNARILIEGIRQGWYSDVYKANLETYIPKNGKPDYRNARHLVNKLDQADKVAGHARSWETELRKREELEKKYTQQATEDIKKTVESSPIQFGNNSSNSTNTPGATILRNSDNPFKLGE
jgi:hypothetical protein